MEENYSLNVLNSAPESECEDSEEIIVLNPSPANPSQASDFTLNHSNFSPTCISAVSSQNFIELLLSSRKAAKLEAQKKIKKSKKPSNNPPKPAEICRMCKMNPGKQLTSCSCYYCSFCVSELETLKKNCPCIKENEIPDNSSIFMLENARLFENYSKAMSILSIIDMLSDSELEEQQKLILNLNTTLVVKVLLDKKEFAWEVPCEFTVKDLRDLMENAAKIRGEFKCNEVLLDSRLMLGFVRLFIWNKSDILSLDLVEIDEFLVDEAL